MESSKLKKSEREMPKAVQMRCRVYTVGILLPRIMSESCDFEMPDFFAKSRIERFCSVRNRSIRIATFLIIVGVCVSIIILSFHFFMFLSMKYGCKLQNFS